MPGPEFFQPRMGQTFYEGNVPRLIKVLERIADSLEQLVKVQEEARALVKEKKEDSDG